jgi:FkbM family methyltransferase
MSIVLPYTQIPPFYAQWGEDRWLVANLEPPTNGVFVDVGAGDGRRGSNTLHFENLGWHGLCVDADPRNHEPLRRRRAAVETCAIASTAGPRPFGMCRQKPSWSGLLRQGGDYEPILVDCQRLETLLRRSEIEQIDLLSIDVEGTELDVWDSFDHEGHQPSIVIVEFDDTRPDRHRDTIQDHLGPDVYRILHDTPANLILQRFDRAWRRRG